MAFNKKKKKVEHGGIIVADNPTSIVAEEYRTIRTNIQFSVIDNELQTLLVTSATAESGKTTTAANLAAAFAAEGANVLLVATDMRKPRLQKVFKSNYTTGLTNLLTDRSYELKDVIRKSDINHLYYLICGPIPPNPSELINSNRMDHVMNEMKEQFDLVIFDSPPLLPVTDAQILAAKVDGTIVVIPQGEVTKAQLDEAAGLLKKVNANVLGTVMNKMDLGDEGYYYYESD